MESLDCLLVHAPKKYNYYPPLNHYSSINWMAHGVFALADALSKEGFRTRILHLGIERVIKPSFEIAEHPAAETAKAVGFSLQFHQQLVDTLAEAEKLKKQLPHCFVFFGGMTAGFFAEELLTTYPFIDAVITGEGETPCIHLLHCLKSHSHDLSRIPNLVWRKDNRIVVNKDLYRASEEELDRMSFANLSYLEHHPHYLNFPKIVFHTRLPGKWNVKLAQRLHSEKKDFFPGLLIGRGCYAACFYCGGGSYAQKLINHRTGVVFRSPEKVIDDICLLQSFGYCGSYISFDPHPMSQDYYAELFRLIRQSKLPFDVIFSAWGLPGKAFLREFALTFKDKSSISISPETGSERLRHISREPFFSNRQLLDTLAFCEELGVRTTVFFSIGIPHETESDFKETLALKKRLVADYEKTSVKAFVIEIEPGSPWHLHPEKFGIHLRRKSLQDFIKDHERPDYSSMRCLGFTKSDFLGEQLADEREYEARLLKLKCRYFCEQRRICPILRAFWSTARLLQLIKIK